MRQEEEGRRRGGRGEEEGEGRRRGEGGEGRK